MTMQVALNGNVLTWTARRESQQKLKERYFAGGATDEDILPDLWVNDMGGFYDGPDWGICMTLTHLCMDFFGYRVSWEHPQNRMIVYTMDPNNGAIKRLFLAEEFDPKKADLTRFFMENGRVTFREAASVEEYMLDPLADWMQELSPVIDGPKPRERYPMARYLMSVYNRPRNTTATIVNFRQKPWMTVHPDFFAGPFGNKYFLREQFGEWIQELEARHGVKIKAKLTLDEGLEKLVVETRLADGNPINPEAFWDGITAETLLAELTRWKEDKTLAMRNAGREHIDNHDLIGTFREVEILMGSEARPKVDTLEQVYDILDRWKKREEERQKGAREEAEAFFTQSFPRPKTPNLFLTWTDRDLIHWTNVFWEIDVLVAEMVRRTISAAYASLEDNADVPILSH